MPFVNTQRGRIFYRQAPGDAPTLLFMHGNLGSSLWWRPILDRLPVGWRGFAYDAIGFGYSDESDRLDRFTVTAQQLDLDSFCSTLQLHSIHLVAHSTATAAAIDYTLSHRDRVASLVLVGSVPASGTSTPPEAYPLLERMPLEPALLAQALHASIPTFAAESEDFRQLHKQAALISPMAFVTIARSLDSWRRQDKLKQLTLPVLLIRGEEDIMLTAEDAQQTLLSVPGANNLEIFRGVGHSPMLEMPQGFAEVLVRFITDDKGEFEAIRQSAEAR